MGKMGNLIVPNHTIIEALPWQRSSTGYQDAVWRYRRKLKLSAPVSRDIARAHAEIAQDICCVVRMKPRGPRGGRGQMHYNGEPRFGEWWPTSWTHAPKGTTFYLVAEVVEQSHDARVRAAAVSNLLPVTPEQAQKMMGDYRQAHPGITKWWMDEASKIHTEQIDALRCSTHLIGDSHEASRSVCDDQSRALGESQD